MSGHTACEWQDEVLNPGPSDPKAQLLSFRSTLAVLTDWQSPGGLANSTASFYREQNKGLETNGSFQVTQDPFGGLFHYTLVPP